jgi:hypothetical protein
MLKPLRTIRSPKHPGAIFLKDRVTNKFLCKVYPHDTERETEEVANQIIKAFTKDTPHD